MQSNQKKIVIIGAGVAGLAAAIRLSVAGHIVTVVEQHKEPGGKLRAFFKDGFSFDKGPSLFTQPENIEALFSLAGEDMQQFFSYRQTAVHCHYFFENGKQVKAYSDLKLFEKELQEKLGEQPASLQKYLRRASHVYEHIATIFLKYSLHKKKTWLHKRIFKALSVLRPALLLKTMHAYNASFFRSKEAIQLFDRYATYNGSNPYTAPAMLCVIPHLEYNSGAYYANGGMISITNALYALAQKKGIQFLFNTKVEKINVQHQRTESVQTQNGFIPADIVLSDIDVYYTYKDLLSDGAKAQNILKQERSSSALIFYWGINKNFSNLGLHNIFFSEDYKAEFNALFKTKEFYSDPTVYINITSKEDASHAPAGMENWFVMVNVPASKNPCTPQEITELKMAVLKKLYKQFEEDIEQCIISETILTPHDIDIETGSYMGSLYGTSSNAALAAFLRHPNFSAEIDGLYFCGGSVHPGGGIPLCLQSAAIVAQLIKDDHG